MTTVTPDLRRLIEAANAAELELMADLDAEASTLVHLGAPPGDARVLAGTVMADTRYRDALRALLAAPARSYADLLAKIEYVIDGDLAPDEDSLLDTQLLHALRRDLLALAGGGDGRA